MPRTNYRPNILLSHNDAARGSKKALLATALLMVSFASQSASQSSSQSSSQSAAQTTSVDFRYAPEYWYSAIGFPEDHHKTLVDDAGALLYDFGPGPYVTPKTRIWFDIDGELARPAQEEFGADVTVRTQSYQDARVPVVETVYRSGSQPVATIRTYAIPPTATRMTAPKLPERQATIVTRTIGLTGTRAWASPPPGYDPAFRNVAWGTNRPIHYSVQVEPGTSRKIALGFCESYRDKPGLRNLLILVEGASPLPFDPIDGGAQNLPQTVQLIGTDDNRDGIIDVEIQATEGDPNTILNVLWVFPADFEVDTDDLLAGRLSEIAEAYVDAGAEEAVRQRETRYDVMTLSSAESKTRTLRIETNRSLEIIDGIVFADGYPFIKSDPKPETSSRTATGLTLTYGPSSRITITVRDGFEASTSAFPDEAAYELQHVRDYWLRDAGVPYSAISVPDRVMQEVIDASIRTVYQSTEIVDGTLIAQPGAALYRGAWMHDGVYFMDLLAQLGDTPRARRVINGLIEFQHETGQAEIMRPNLIHRETALLIWGIVRFAELTGDDAWLLENWHHVSAGVDWIRHLREQTLVDGASNYGLTPSGFADGGIHGVQPEYASVSWILNALPSAIRTAQRLGKNDQAQEWRLLYNEFLQSFRTAAKRDMRTDDHGNSYLPIRVGDAGSADLPTRAQWTLPEALAFGEHILPTDQLAVGTIKMLEANQSQGLILNTGWLNNGIWVYFGGLLSEAYLRTDDGKKAADLLYAMANHASPLSTWPEEQMPVGAGRRTAGDYPHSWASSTMPRLAIRLLAFEDGRDLTLLRGMPEEWLTDGSTTVLRNVATRFGPLNLRVEVSEGGETARVIVGPMRARKDATITVDWKQFEAAGFHPESPAVHPTWGQEFDVTLKKRR